MTDPEDRDYQADVCRALAYYLNAPLSEGCRLLGVLPVAGAARVAVRAGDDETGMSFIYEIPVSAVAPGMVSAFLRSVLSGPQFYSSSDVDEVMGMTLIRLRPEKIGAFEELEGDLALAVLRSLAAPPPADEEEPFLIGFLMREQGVMRLYVHSDARPGITGVDISLTGPLTALVGSIPSLLGEEQYIRSAEEDPHCDVLMDLTDW
ncbi:hypothetical protein ACIF83_36225 [Streptomyces sp. NPDC085866]|uniref:hypothetical protein n=1 Tax=Streptomyces sp. NPDC085866 TaxID=3365736 RepID=UPI0037D4720D